MPADIFTGASSNGPRHVFITGASSGLGAALAVRYASTTDRLTLVARSSQRLTEVARQCRLLGAEVRIRLVDVRDAEDIHRTVEEADSWWPIDLLIANAGIGGRRAIAGTTGETPEHAAEIAAVNFGGVVNTVAPIVGEFSRRREGHIVIVSSLAAVGPMPVCPVYAAAKAGVAHYARQLRLLLSPAGVSVTTVLIGFVGTPMSDEVPGPKPLLITADEAAERIAGAVARRSKQLVYPRSLWLLAKLADAFPDWANSAVARRIARDLS